LSINTIIVGHYGSGKTEFCINFILQLADLYNNLAIIDLDIVNVYFRSRQKAKLLESKGIKVYSSAIGHDANQDIPALAADILTPLQDDNCHVVIDVGGDEVGTRVLARYKEIITAKGYEMLCVVNAKREQTQDTEGIIKHIQAIEQTSGLKTTGLINNTHLLHETTVADVLQGQKLTEDVSKQLNIPIKYICATENLTQKLSPFIKGGQGNLNLMPIKLYMREKWMN